MLTSSQITLLKKELATAKNPLFFFDDDPDGLCSFLILYHLYREGHGVVIKTQPKITLDFLRKVQEYHPDKLFILDLPLVDQEFLDQVKVPVFWIDHHPPIERERVNYFNPRLREPSLFVPVTRLAYQISQDPADLWLAVIGCLGDHYLPDFLPEFQKKYPSLLKKDLLKKENLIELALYQEPIGYLVRIFSFLLKGKTSEVTRSLKILLRINSPLEILNQETLQSKYLYRRFEKINQRYLFLLAKAKQSLSRASGPLLVYTYTEQSWSFTSELASELLYLNPDKTILVARRKAQEFKCSLRSKKKNLLPLLKRALLGLDGYGGGHEKACGITLKVHDWNSFLTNLQEELKKET